MIFTTKYVIGENNETQGTLPATNEANGNNKLLRPNLIFIMTDQQRYDALSYAGNNPILQTPNMDRIAREGVHFENAYTQCPVCGPARTSLLTGCVTLRPVGDTRAIFYP